MNDIHPGKCVFCGQEKKPSFREYYCDCEDILKKSIKIAQDKIDAETDLLLGLMGKGAAKQSIQIIRKTLAGSGCCPPGSTCSNCIHLYFGNPGNKP